MNNKILRYVLPIALLCLLLSSYAFAEVVTSDKTDGYTDYVYVAGSTDSYPFEYYDDEADCFRGVIPDLLAKVSEKSGVNFVYINGSGQDKKLLAQNLQADIISCEDAEKVSYAKEYTELACYKTENGTKHLGIAFTSVMEDEKIAKVKDAISKISSAEKNGMYLAYAKQQADMDYLWIFVNLAVIVILTIVAVVLVLRIKKLRKKNEEDKLIDDETGLGNFAFFRYHFKNTISDIARNLYYIAYIIVDSSYLRDYYGDSAFEDALTHTAATLSEYTADREISARVAANGFAFAFQATNDEDAKQRITEVMDRLNGFGNSSKDKGKLVFYSAVYNLSSSDKNCEILLFNLRKNCHKIYDTDNQILFCDTHSMNRVQEEKKLTESIIKGFENNEFKMYLQFIVDNHTGRIFSAEALSRWDSREKGLIAPSKYISNMESAGLISRHDYNMFTLVCEQLAKWKDTEYKDISISCNFTRITLSEKDFIDKLKNILEKYDFDRSKLAIEITEDAIERDTEAATQNVVLCKELGFKICLDDMGSGYTALVNLCDYPIDVVKIDRNIIRKADTERGSNLLSGIIALAHSLGVKVICEGIETEKQCELVASSECDYVQGWYFFKPVPSEECEAFADKYNCNLSVKA